MQLRTSRNNQTGRRFAIAASFALSAAAMPASGSQPPVDELDLLAGAGHAKLATVTSGRGCNEMGPAPSGRFYNNNPRKLPSLAPVWNVTEPWKLALDSRIFVDPERAARAALGFVEIGAIYSPLKDLDFAMGFVRNAKDGAFSAIVFTMGVAARY